MKVIIILFLMIAISCSRPPTLAKNNNKEILLYFINDQTLTLRPGQITEDEFWESPENLDTLKLKDSTREYITKFNNLQDTILYSSDEVDLFPHVFAFVFQTDNKSDTIYANRRLELFEWKGKKRFYKDTTFFFKDKFYALSNVK
jgi:hypothetical protein